MVLQISDFKKIVHLKVNPPTPINWVVSNRELVLYGYGVDLMEENKLLAMARSATPADERKLREEFPSFSIPVPDPARVRMNCHCAG